MKRTAPIAVLIVFSLFLTVFIYNTVIAKEQSVKNLYQLIEQNSLYQLTDGEKDCIIRKEKVDDSLARCLASDKYARYYPPLPKNLTAANPAVNVRETPWFIEARRYDKDIGYLKIKSFVTLVRYYAKNELGKFRQHNVGKIIIDLRDNEGLLTSAAAEFLELFSPKRDILMFTRRGRNEKFIEFKYTDKRGPYYNMDIVVLVNKKTASASELTAGVLQSWGATVIGTNTSAKGSVQMIVITEEGGLFGFTTSRYYFSDGTTLEETGILPDIIEEIDDKQLEKAINFLKKIK